MARGAITPAALSRAGVALTETTGDATNGHSIAANDGRVFILARNSNGSATARTVSVLVEQQVDGQTVAAKSMSVAAGATKAFGPFPKAVYGETLLVDVDNAEMFLRAVRYPAPS